MALRALLLGPLSGMSSMRKRRLTSVVLIILVAGQHATRPLEIAAQLKKFEEVKTAYVKTCTARSTFSEENCPGNAASLAASISDILRDTSSTDEERNTLDLALKPLLPVAVDASWFIKARNDVCALGPKEQLKRSLELAKTAEQLDSSTLGEEEAQHPTCSYRKPAEELNVELGVDEEGDLVFSDTGEELISAQTLKSTIQYQAQLPDQVAAAPISAIELRELAAPIKPGSLILTTTGRDASAAALAAILIVVCVLDATSGNDICLPLFLNAVRAIAYIINKLIVKPLKWIWKKGKEFWRKGDLTEVNGKKIWKTTPVITEMKECFVRRFVQPPQVEQDPQFDKDSTVLEFLRIALPESEVSYDFGDTDFGYHVEKYGDYGGTDGGTDVLKLNQEHELRALWAVVRIPQHERNIKLGCKPVRERSDGSRSTDGRWECSYKRTKRTKKTLKQDAEVVASKGWTWQRKCKTL